MNYGLPESQQDLHVDCRGSMVQTVSTCGVGGDTYTSYIFKCLSSEAVTSNMESGENVNERIGIA